MKRLLSRHSFAKQSAIFLVLSVLAAIMNYALYPILARILPAASFGDFTTVLALSNQILGILIAFNLTSIYLVKTQPSKVALEHAQAIQKILIWFFTFITLLIGIFSPFINHQLHFSSPYSLGILAIILICSIPTVIWTGYLQGNKQLGIVGVYTVSNSFSKLIFSIIFAKLWGVNGGLLGVLVGTLCGLVMVAAISHIKLPRISSVFSALTASDRAFLRKMRLYIAGSVVVVGMMSLLQNVDILFAKSFFDPTSAGFYTGISIISNALYFVAFLLVWIILPQVSTDNHRANRTLLIRSYAVLTLGGAIALLVIALAGQQLIATALGENFKSSAYLLIYAAIYQLLLVGITLFVYYLLVIRSYYALLLSGLSFSFVVGFGFMSHTTLLQLVRALDIALLCAITSYCIITLINRSKHRA